MSIVLLLLLLAQFDPDAGFSLANLRERQQARNDLVNAVLTNNYALAKTALEEKADPNDIIILSQDENMLLKSVSPRMYYYYSNGADFRPLHLAAGLGETRDLPIAGGRRSKTVRSQQRIRLGTRPVCRKDRTSRLGEYPLGHRFERRPL